MSTLLFIVFVVTIAAVVVAVSALLVVVVAFVFLKTVQKETSDVEGVQPFAWFRTLTDTLLAFDYLSSLSAYPRTCAVGSLSFTTVSFFFFCSCFTSVRMGEI